MEVITCIILALIGVYMGKTARKHMGELGACIDKRLHIH